MPDLTPLQGRDAGQAGQYFLAHGYKPVNSRPDCRIFRDPGATHLVHLSSLPALGRDFSAACSAAPENPHLPKILEEHALGPALYLRVSENLLSCKDFPADTRQTVCGLARAFSSLFEGDDIHVNVHPLLRDSLPLREAVRRVIACGESLSNPARPDAVAVRIERRGHSILFRPDTNEPVFASPLVPASGSPKATYRRLQLIRTRFSDEEMARPDSRYWPKIPKCDIA